MKIILATGMDGKPMIEVASEGESANVIIATYKAIEKELEKEEQC